MLEFFRRLGSIQFDPIPVAGRSHDLVLHARVADYEPAWCDLLYERREIFEAYNKGLSFVPRTTCRGSASGRRARVQSVLDENAEAAERVLERIRVGRAALVARLRARRAGRRPTGSACRRTPSAPCSRRTPSPACSASRGATAIAATTTWSSGSLPREGARTRDPVPRAAPAQDAVALPRARPARRQRRRRRLRRPRPREARPRYPEYPGRNALREELVELGELVPVEVEGVGGQALRRPRRGRRCWRAPPEPPPSVAFLSPFDALVWDRKLLGSLFEFDYVWDLFHPPEKRRFGYYVLPILFRDRFVGRIEPQIDRAEGRVQVLGLWWEDGFTPRRVDGFVDAMRSALRAYLGFAGADRLEWAPHLGSDKRLFLTGPDRTPGRARRRVRRARPCSASRRRFCRCPAGLGSHRRGTGSSGRSRR